MPKSNDEHLELALKRWKRLVRKMAYHEERSKYLFEQLEASRKTIKKLRDELERNQPRYDTKWGWLTWALRHKRVLSMRVTHDSTDGIRAEIVRIRSILAMAVWHSFRIKPLSDGTIEIVKGEPFGQRPTAYGQKRMNIDEEKAESKE